MRLWLYNNTSTILMFVFGAAVVLSFAWVAVVKPGNPYTTSK